MHIFMHVIECFHKIENCIATRAIQLLSYSHSCSSIDGLIIVATTAYIHIAIASYIQLYSIATVLCYSLLYSLQSLSSCCACVLNISKQEFIISYIMNSCSKAWLYVCRHVMLQNLTLSMVAKKGQPPRQLHTVPLTRPPIIIRWPPIITWRPPIQNAGSRHFI